MTHCFQRPSIQEMKTYEFIIFRGSDIKEPMGPGVQVIPRMLHFLLPIWVGTLHSVHPTPDHLTWCQEAIRPHTPSVPYSLLHFMLHPEPTRSLAPPHPTHFCPAVSHYNNKVRVQINSYNFIWTYGFPISGCVQLSSVMGLVVQCRYMLFGYLMGSGMFFHYMPFGNSVSNVRCGLLMKLKIWKFWTTQ